jgi:hypothetical protein
MGITRLKRKARRNKTTSRLREQGKKRATLIAFPVVKKENEASVEPVSAPVAVAEHTVAETAVAPEVASAPTAEIAETPVANEETVSTAEAEPATAEEAPAENNAATEESTEA